MGNRLKMARPDMAPQLICREIGSDLFEFEDLGFGVWGLGFRVFWSRSLDLHLAIVCGDRAPIIPELCAHNLPLLGEEVELLNADNLLIHSARSGLGLGLSCYTKTTRKFMMWVSGFRDCASAL